MKKRHLKKWFEKILLLINSIIFVLIGTGIESFLNSSKNILILIILLLIFIFNHMLLYKYTKIFIEK